MSLGTRWPEVGGVPVTVTVASGRVLGLARRQPKLRNEKIPVRLSVGPPKEKIMPTTQTDPWHCFFSLGPRRHCRQRRPVKTSGPFGVQMIISKSIAKN